MLLTADKMYQTIWSLAACQVAAKLCGAHTHGEWMSIRSFHLMIRAVMANQTDVRPSLSLIQRNRGK